MESQLRQRILLDRLSNVSLADSISMRASKIQPRPKDQAKLNKIKKIIVGSMVAIFCIYNIFFETSSFQCFIDMSHEATQFLNKLANNSEVFYNIISIISQQTIEIEILMIVVLGIMRAKNLRIHMFVALFYGLRAILLNIQKLPYPQGMISYQPVFPAFTVPYGMTRDFYYSGHTGIMLFSVLLWGKLKYRKLQVISFFMLCFVVFVLIITRVHYSIDVVGAIIFTLWIQKYVLCHVVYFDYLFTIIYKAIISLYKCLSIAVS